MFTMEDEVVNLDVDELKIQVLSDVHLELRVKLPRTYKIPPIKVTGNVVFLAGDIGYPHLKLYREFLEFCSKSFLLTVLVAGNHEFYHRKLAVQDTILKIHELSNTFPNVVFLNNTTLTINYKTNSIKVFGATLWSNPDPSIKHEMNDYEKITLYGEENYRRKLRPRDVLKLHEESVLCLESAIKNADRLIILSHHLPSFRILDERHRKEPIFTAYATDLERFFDHPIVLWIHGHYHEAKDSVIGGIRVVSNPYGYMSENTGYSEDLLITL